MVATQRIESECLSKAYIAATLLSRSEERAETAVMASIRSVNSDREADQELYRTTLAAAIELERRSPPIAADEIGQISSYIPIELRRVMLLPQRLRHCFVLRLLAGMPLKWCAQVLLLAPVEVDQLACLSAQALARTIEQNGRSQTVATLFMTFP